MSAADSAFIDLQWSEGGPGQQVDVFGHLAIVLHIGAAVVLTQHPQLLPARVRASEDMRRGSLPWNI